MSIHTWRVIALAAVVGVVLGAPSLAGAQSPRTAPLPPGVRVPDSPVEPALKPDLSCSVFFATDEKGAKRISGIVEASDSLKRIYLFYTFRNAGKGKAVDVPVEATVQGSLKIPVQGSPTRDPAYCPTGCKIPGKVTVNAGVTNPPLTLRVGGGDLHDLEPVGLLVKEPR